MWSAPLSHPIKVVGDAISYGLRISVSVFCSTLRFSSWACDQAMVALERGVSRGNLIRISLPAPLFVFASLFSPPFMKLTGNLHAACIGRASAPHLAAVCVEQDCPNLLPQTLGSPMGFVFALPCAWHHAAVFSAENAICLCGYVGTRMASPDGAQVNAPRFDLPYISQPARLSLAMRML